MSAHDMLAHGAEAKPVDVIPSYRCRKSHLHWFSPKRPWLTHLVPNSLACGFCDGVMDLVVKDSRQDCSICRGFHDSRKEHPCE